MNNTARSNQINTFWIRETEAAGYAVVVERFAICYDCVACVVAALGADAEGGG